MKDISSKLFISYNIYIYKHVNDLYGTYRYITNNRHTDGTAS